MMDDRNKTSQTYEQEIQTDSKEFKTYAPVMQKTYEELVQGLSTLPFKHLPKQLEESPYILVASKQKSGSGSFTGTKSHVLTFQNDMLKIRPSCKRLFHETISLTLERDDLKAQHRVERDKRICDRASWNRLYGRVLLLRIMAMLTKMTKEPGKNNCCNLIWLRLPICCDLLLVRSTLWSRRKSQHLGNLAHPNCSVYSCPIPKNAT